MTFEEAVNRICESAGCESRRHGPEADCCAARVLRQFRDQCFAEAREQAAKIAISEIIDSTTDPRFSHANNATAEVIAARIREEVKP